MTTLNKKIHPGIAIFAVFIALIIATLGVSYAHAQPSTVTFQTTAAATTTLSFIGVGTATSTYQFDDATFSNGKVANMQQIDSIALYEILVASSSSSVLTTTYQVSNNNIDWYTASTSSWTPGVTGTSTNVLMMPVYPTQHARVRFSLAGAAGAIYAEVDLKKNPSTP
jgi:hypothetical protein